MRTHYDYFQIREVKETDTFSEYASLGFVAPIKVRIINNETFNFAYAFHLQRGINFISAHIFKGLHCLAENSNIKNLYLYR